VQGTAGGSVSVDGIARKLAGGPAAPLFSTGRVSAVNAIDRPPTLTVGDGDLAKPVTLTGPPSEWHPGDIALYVNSGPAPTAVARLPLRGIGDPFDDPDESEPLEPWHLVGAAGEPGFENGWGNAAGWAPAGFYMQPDYWVRLQGVVGGGSSTTATIFTLPVEYRPAGTLTFTVYSSTAIAKLRIGTDGTVAITNGGGTLSVSLNGVTFPTRWNITAWQRPQEANGWSWVAGSTSPDPAMFVRDDGWVWLRGAMAGGGANGIQMTSPEDARSVLADVFAVAGLGTGLGRWDHGGGGGSDRGSALWRQRSGGTGENVLGGINYWSHLTPSGLFAGFTFANGWANYGDDFRTCSYYRDHFGVVHLRGLANGAAKTSNTLGTLPVGYRPAGELTFNAIKTGNTQARVDVNPDGTVEDALGSTGYLSLSGVSFRAEQ
jgi:hypothetical protein